MPNNNPKIPIEPTVAESSAVTEVPKKVIVEKIIEVPTIEYIEVPVERVVEVPEIVEDKIFKEVLVPQYVEKPYAEIVQVDVPYEVKRNIPVPIETKINYDVYVSKQHPEYNIKKYSVVLPRFVEIPVPRELYSEVVQKDLEEINKRAEEVCSRKVVCLSELEEVVTRSVDTEFKKNLDGTKIKKVLAKGLKEGKIPFA